MRDVWPSRSGTRGVAGALAAAAIGAGQFVAVLGGSGLAAASGALSGTEIEAAVVGKRIYLATPFGGEFPMNYRTDGRVDADGKALGLGTMVAPKDSGRWWVDGDKLCQQWRTWYDGKAFCFTLRQSGPTTLQWRRDDGMAGTARIE
jgi:hypothetical protein